MQAEPRAEGQAEAIERLRKDGLVAYPTETVWGLAAVARSPRAIEALQRWKGRPEGQPLSLIVAASDVTAQSVQSAIGVPLPELARTLASAHWPGPLTLVVPAAPGRFPNGVAREDGAVGLRCSSHPVASALAEAAEQAGLGPLTATSLNRSGQSPARTREDARRMCAGAGAPWQIEAGEDAWGAAPSTVVDCCGSQPRILREGAIARDAITADLRHTAADPADPPDHSDPPDPRNAESTG